jgi:hypothetical protein
MGFAQSSHRQTFIDILADDIRTASSDQSFPFHTAATRVILQWLGYELDDVMFIDSQDRGVDAWLVTESGIDIFQIKTHDLDPNGLLNLSPFNGHGVRDLDRAKHLLLHERESNITSKALKVLLQRWASAIRNHKYAGTTTAMPVTLHLVVLGDGLTREAHAELQAFQASNAAVIEDDGVPIQFHAALRTIDDIIEGRWRERNREWVDLRGRRYDQIQLRPWKEGAISDDANAIFYCLAIDLVNAYEALGYQLFEPNVRANIKTSRVNHAIRDSVLHQRTRREFRFLNNGVTIICEQFSKPGRQRSTFTVRHPGVVNGLQTVVALHTAYQQLSPTDKEDFERNCSVLVRLLLNHAVDDITKVVKATNNQNPMKLRNLASNSTEQLIYARIFAEELGWFYEAKEGAWDAFEKDPRRWRPPLNKLPRDFRATNRRKVRRIDNEDLAQTWMAFIGFASEAVNEKKGIFEERFYPLIFTHQTRRHGVDYDFTLARARDEAIAQSPNARLMLLSWLAREFAAEMVPTAAQNREEACARLGIDPARTSKAELDVRLSQDNRFVLNQALGGMSLLFVEFVGFVCYRTLDEQLHRHGHRLLANGSFASLATQFDIDLVKAQVEAGTTSADDVLAILWQIFVEKIDDMVNSAWGDSYRAAPVKVRFVFNPRDTRERLYRTIQSLDSFMQKRSVKESWAVGIPEGQGLFSFVRNCVLDEPALIRS